MKILLIGAYGFLGNHLLKGLLQENEYKIHILIKQQTIQRFSVKGLYNVHYYGEKNYLEKLKKEKIEIVINCSVSYRTNKDKNLINEINFLLPSMIIDQLKNTLKMFINFDSYFTKPEFKNYIYLKEYIKSKSKFVSSIDHNINYTFLNLRLEHLYGLYDSDYKFIKSIYNDLKNNKPVINLTHGNQKRDFIYVNDVVNLVCKILKTKSQKKGKINHDVGTGISISIKDFIKILKKLLNSQSKLNFGSVPYRKNEIMDSKSNFEPLYIEYGWTPNFNVEKGLLNMIKSENH